MSSNTIGPGNFIQQLANLQGPTGTGAANEMQKLAAEADLLPFMKSGLEDLAGMGQGSAGMFRDGFDDQNPAALQNKLAKDQALQDRLQKIEEEAQKKSNISKAMHDTAMSIINNLK